MKEDWEKRVAEVLEKVSQANSAMIDIIKEAVDEKGEVPYEVVVNGTFDIRETRTVALNDDGEYMVFDENDNEVQALEDLSADDLFNIVSAL